MRADTEQEEPPDNLEVAVEHKQDVVVDSWLEDIVVADLVAGDTEILEAAAVACVAEAAADLPEQRMKEHSEP